MTKVLSAVMLAVLFASCTGGPRKQFQATMETPQPGIGPGPSVIIDYKNKEAGGTIPEWVNRWLVGGSGGIETMDAYLSRYAFVAHAEGNNFNALTQWSKGFSPDLDFPRLAAARVEARFSSDVPFPDNEYGSFFEALIRAASDASWTGAERVDDFWVYRKFFPSGAGGEDQGSLTEDESWEYMILVTIDRASFISQFETIFQSVKPSPLPSKAQISAANRVKDRLDEGF